MSFEIYIKDFVLEPKYVRKVKRKEWNENQQQFSKENGENNKRERERILTTIFAISFLFFYPESLSSSNDSHDQEIEKVFTDKELPQYIDVE